MKLFMPERVFFEPIALEYPLGEKLYSFFQEKGIEVNKTSINNVYKSIPGLSEQQKYARAKKTIVVTVKKNRKLDVCKPSADFEFALASNCPGNCEYCYLQSTQGLKPYLRVYVNLEEIFETIKEHADQSGKLITTFEVASGGDPLSLEHITGTLGKTINFFGSLSNAKLRVVTKFSNVASILDANHQGHTRFRVSLNSNYVIKNFEHNTASLKERIEAAAQIAQAGYPIGFVVAPIMVHTNWKEEYDLMLQGLRSGLREMKLSEPITFELIQHRFTANAKKNILERFPNTKLDMEESGRTLKWGKYGRFKYVYPKETVAQMKEFLFERIHQNFPEGVIQYFT